MYILCPTAPRFPIIRNWAQACEYQNGAAPTACIVDCGAQTLGTDVDMHDYSLRLVGQTCVAVGHGKGDHFVRAGDNAGKSARASGLPFDDCFEDGGVIGAEIDEAMGYSSLSDGQEGLAGVICTLALARIECSFFQSSFVEYFMAMDLF